MAFVIRFSSMGMTTDKYDAIIERLELAGAGAPTGRQYHVCFGDKDNLQVSDIWDSMDNFQKFGETLMPILAEFGVHPNDPQFIEVYNSISG